MTPDDPCAPRPITPGECRFLSRIGRESGIDLSAYGLTDDLLVKPISPNPCGGITFDFDGVGYRMRRTYYYLVEGSFNDSNGIDSVQFSLSLDALGTLYELDVIINGDEPIDYPLDSDPIVIRYPRGEVQLATVQSIPWQNPTLPPSPIEIRKIHPDEFDFLSRLSRESGVDLFSLGLSEVLLVKPHSTNRNGSIEFMIEARQYSDSSNRFVINGTFHDSDGIPATFSVGVNKRDKLSHLLIHRIDRRPLTRLPQITDLLEFQYP